MINRLVNFGIVSLLSLTSVWAQTGSNAISLEEAQQHAIANNAEVVNANVDVKIAQKKIWETTAIGLPQLKAEAGYTYQFEVPTMDFSGMMPEIPGMPAPEPVELGQHSTTSYTVSLSQLLFSGEYIVGLQASKTYKRFAEENYENQTVTIKETVANSYFTALVMEENLRLLDSSLLLMKSTNDEVQAMTQTGFAEQTDADQMALNLAQLENQKKNLARQTELSHRVLKFNMGMPLDSTISLSQNLGMLLAQANAVSDSGSFSVENHIQYRMLQTNEDLMRLDWRRYQSAYLPTVAAFYQHKGYAEEPEVSFEPKDLAGVTVSVPLFTSGQRHSRAQQAKMEYTKAQNSKAQVAEALTIGVIQAETAFLNATETFETQKGNMELAGRIFHNYLIKQKNGMASSMDVTTAQNQYLQTQTEYFKSMFDVLRLKVALDKAKGLL